MEFFHWNTHYDLTVEEIRRRDGRHVPLKEYLEFIEGYNGTAMFSNKELDRQLIVAEGKWLKDERPYYNIHTPILKPASRLRLDQISLKQLVFPGHLRSVVLNLPKDNNLDVRNILVTESHRPDCKFTIYNKLNSEDPNLIVLGYIFIPDADISIEEYVDTKVAIQIEEQSLGTSQERHIEGLKTAIKLYAMVNFLSDCPNEDLINYDVINRFKSEYFEVKTSKERREEIEKISRKRGKIGWEIGAKLCITDNGRLTEPAMAGETTGRTLSYQHIRTGHLHAYHVGKGRGKILIRWINPTTVKPGLPFKE